MLLQLTGIGSISQDAISVYCEAVPSRHPPSRAVRRLTASSPIELFDRPARVPAQIRHRPRRGRHPAPNPWVVEGVPGCAGSVPGRTAGLEIGQYTEGELRCGPGSKTRTRGGD